MQPVWCLFLLSAGDTWPVFVVCQWKKASGGGRGLEVISTFPQIDHIEFYTQKIKPIYFLLIGDSSREPRSVLVWQPESQNRTDSLGPGFFIPVPLAGKLTLGRKGCGTAAGVLLSGVRRDGLPQSSRAWSVEQFFLAEGEWMVTRSPEAVGSS